ncbi:hypothetical protein GCM10008934_24760 [Virgibacillus salarius]|uniref:hypothetical protein n=1 Tax=Virgibacillus salarius TaxID=447199 RepID=UPI0031D85F66
MKTVEEIKNFTENMSNATTLMILNEAIQNAQSTDERVELLVFKCQILEGSTYGKVFIP